MTRHLFFQAELRWRHVVRPINLYKKNKGPHALFTYRAWPNFVLYIYILI
jgi:hypothetical protein